MSVWRISIGNAIVDVLGPHILTHIQVGMGVPLCVDTDLLAGLVRAWAWWAGATKELMGL